MIKTIPIPAFLLTLILSTAYAQGFEATKLAAEQGYAQAQNNLGNMYREGEGGPKNDVEASRWHKLAVVQCHAHSQFNLGVMYTRGEGVPENTVMAYVWYSLAADQGFAPAIEGRDLIKTELSQEQLGLRR